MKQIVMHSSRSHDRHYDDECLEVVDYVSTSITHKPKRSAGLINKFNDLDLCSTSIHKFASSQDKPLSILASAT
jgi:hypothetical protein